MTVEFKKKNTPETTLCLNTFINRAINMKNTLILIIVSVSI